MARLVLTESAGSFLSILLLQTLIPTGSAVFVPSPSSLSLKQRSMSKLFRYNEVSTATLAGAILQRGYGGSALLRRLKHWRHRQRDCEACSVVLVVV